MEAIKSHDEKDKPESLRLGLISQKEGKYYG